MTGVAAALVLFVPLVPFVRRFLWGTRRGAETCQSTSWPMLVASFAHTWMLAQSRALLFPLFDLGPTNYGDMRVRYSWSGTALPRRNPRHDDSWGTTASKSAPAGESPKRKLRAELARQKCRTWRGGCNPHFLFNAL